MPIYAATSFYYAGRPDPWQPAGCPFCDPLCTPWARGGPCLYGRRRSYIFQPTFGYLVGFIAGAWLTGKLREMSGSWSFGKVLFANLAGLAVVYLFGMVYVYFINNFYIGKTIGVWAVILYCFLLAVPGDICLCILAAFLSKRLVKALGIHD